MRLDRKVCREVECVDVVQNWVNESPGIHTNFSNKILHHIVNGSHFHVSSRICMGLNCSPELGQWTAESKMQA
jgi:hypothetical protein